MADQDPDDAALTRALAVPPRLALGRFPTALERVRGLVDDDVELWVKREDQAGGPYGGNKVRKLEYLLAPLAAGTRVLTSGGTGSHHVLATAVYGRRRGLLVDAVLYPQPATAHAEATAAAARAAGATLFPAASYLGVPVQVARALRRGPRIEERRSAALRAIEERHSAALRAIEERRSAALRAIIAPGGSTPLGTLGWVGGGREIAAQVAAGEAPRFDAVYAALGSGGMVAGLWLGLGAAAAELVAVPVVPALVGNRITVALLAWRTARLLKKLGAARLPPRPALRLRRGFLGGGYGHETAAALEAQRRAADAGLVLEATYTGKALAALLADAQAGRLRGRRVLFIDSYAGTETPREG